MTAREEMQSLAHDIVRSHEDRIAGIAQLRERTEEVREGAKTDLKEFRDSWAAMSRELKADLAKSVADRKRDIAAMLNGFEAEIKELNRTHAAMSKELKADLSRSAADLKRDVASMVKGFDDAHAAMSRQMKAGLAEGVADRKKGVAECKRDVGVMLKGFDSELREVHVMLAIARDEWQKLTATMRERRGMPVREVKPPEVVVPSPPHVEVIAKEEAVAGIEATPAIAALQERVFEYLANHPDGRRLVELEQEFGVARIQMARVLKGLTSQNRVQKWEGVYFAI